MIVQQIKQQKYQGFEEIVHIFSDKKYQQQKKAEIPKIKQITKLISQMKQLENQQIRMKICKFMNLLYLLNQLYSCVLIPDFGHTESDVKIIFLLNSGIDENNKFTQNIQNIMSQQSQKIKAVLNNFNKQAKDVENLQCCARMRKDPQLSLKYLIFCHNPNKIILNNLLIQYIKAILLHIMTYSDLYQIKIVRTKIVCLFIICLFRLKQSQYPPKQSLNKLRYIIQQYDPHKMYVYLNGISIKIMKIHIEECEKLILMNKKNQN